MYFIASLHRRGWNSCRSSVSSAPSQGPFTSELTIKRLAPFTHAPFTHASRSLLRHVKDHDVVLYSTIVHPSATPTARSARGYLKLHFLCDSNELWAMTRISASFTPSRIHHRRQGRTPYNHRTYKQTIRSQNRNNTHLLHSAGTLIKKNFASQSRHRLTVYPPRPSKR